MNYEQLVKDLDEEGRIRLYRALERAGVGTYQTWQHMVLGIEHVDIGPRQTIPISTLNTFDGEIDWKGYLEDPYKYKIISQELEKEGWEIISILQNGVCLFKRRVSKEGRSVCPALERIEKLAIPIPDPEPSDVVTPNNAGLTEADLRKMMGILKL